MPFLNVAVDGRKPVWKRQSEEKAKEVPAMWEVITYMDGEDGIFYPCNVNVVGKFTDKDYGKAKELVKELENQGFNVEMRWR